MQVVLASSIDIREKASCESPWVDTVGPAVEKLLLSRFA